MPDINELKDKINTKTLNMVLLSSATLGLYLLLWLVRTNQKISETTKIKLVDNTYIIWLAVCLGWSGALSNVGEALFDALSGMDLLAQRFAAELRRFKQEPAYAELHARYGHVTAGITKTVEQ